MIKLAIPLAIVTLLSACANADYQKYSETQVTIARYKAEAEKARYQVLAEVVKKGDPTASVAAIMSMQMGMGGAQEQKIDAPKNASDDAFKWASLLLPTVVQGFGIMENAKVATTQSNNAAAVSMNTNGTFASIANTGSNNQASMAANANSGFVSIAGSATTALTSVANSSNTALANLGNSSNTALSNLAVSSNNSLTSMAATNSTTLVGAMASQANAYNTVLGMDLTTLNTAVSKLTSAPVVINNGVLLH
jgi:hypothetical protein